ncbi:HlyD family type I secretion periplasmic adaptor subunit [Niveibacterium sp. 24ML]|uniref:HlyD family type I secretion periplasmic adaptor subunit n=1 Tax=Niveibacterium sp. 24ML TaxID=2985512 RepID=UPI00226DD6B1|nr:HlyD family type I secretion periplasmic adaptor subunit [Niveibacterium sp. 24ML]MCX9158083.1 HlyD family type I secretion periplasmic adaptor subunit [Niveibacterium sp. 24ML]
MTTANPTATEAVSAPASSENPAKPSRLPLRLQATADLLRRYKAVFAAAWAQRHQWQTPERTPLERQFLPATLELLETPPSPLPRIIVGCLIAFFLIALAWAIFGKIDIVAVAHGKVIASGQSKVVQPMETAVVTHIRVRDGQAVKAGDVLVELDATAAGADAHQARDGLQDTQLAAARAQALLTAMDTNRSPTLQTSGAAEPARLAKERALLASQYAEYVARIAALESELAKREAERRATEELAAKLEQTAPIARQRAEDYKNLVDQSFVSRHGYLEREQARIEAERDLAYQKAKLVELEQGIKETRGQRDAYRAEFRRQTTETLAQAEAKVASLGQDVKRTENRARLMQLTAPVDGTVQQLAIHTEGGVVTPAQALMVIVPREDQAEVEAVLENKDIGFVKAGQVAEIKVETFPFTRYGTIPAQVNFVSGDAIKDDKLGFIFQARLKLDRNAIRVDERQVPLSPGMAVSAEIKTGQRRVIEYLLSPVLGTTNESLRER